ncbi:hypothetical protein PS15m_007162 [Mucor circinelloides]
MPHYTFTFNLQGAILNNRESTSFTFNVNVNPDAQANNNNQLSDVPVALPVISIPNATHSTSAPSSRPEESVIHVCCGSDDDSDDVANNDDDVDDEEFVAGNNAAGGHNSSVIYNGNDDENTMADVGQQTGGDRENEVDAGENREDGDDEDDELGSFQSYGYINSQGDDVWKLRHYTFARMSHASVAKFKTDIRRVRSRQSDDSQAQCHANTDGELDHLPEANVSVDDENNFDCDHDQRTDAGSAVSDDSYCPALPNTMDLQGFNQSKK